MKQEGGKFRATIPEWGKLILDPLFGELREGEVMVIGDVARDQDNPVTLVPLSRPARLRLGTAFQRLDIDITKNPVSPRGATHS